jgi:hypothetical protein
MSKKLPRSYTIVFEERPDFGINKERSVHHMVRAKITKHWREAFCALAQDAMIPHMTEVEIIAQPYVINGRYRQDVAFGCAGNVKAAIDGVVDAGVLIDDNANIVTKITFLAPILGRDALALTLIPTE